MYQPKNIDKWKRASNYMGEEWNDYYILLSQTRDSGCLTRSNFTCALERIGGELTANDDTPMVCIVRNNHWACGWLEFIAIHETADKQLELADKLAEELSNYPVVDEEHFSDLECEEAGQVWKDCYSPKERIAYIRANPSQFEFNCWSDLRAVVNGEYFNGYASELLG
jgi:hypothetical protein